jgi:hypothetical protein
VTVFEPIIGSIAAVIVVVISDATAKVDMDFETLASTILIFCHGRRSGGFLPAPATPIR